MAGRKRKLTDQERAILNARLAMWRALGPKEQLASLDERLGVGVGAKRQRAKLANATAKA